MVIQPSSTRTTPTGHAQSGTSSQAAGPSRFMATLRTLLGGAHPAGRTPTATAAGTSTPSGKPRHTDATATLLARLHATDLLHPAGGKQQTQTSQHDDTTDASTLHALVLPGMTLNVLVTARGSSTQRSELHVRATKSGAMHEAHGASPSTLRALAQMQPSHVDAASTNTPMHAGTTKAATPPAQATATTAFTAPTAPTTGTASATAVAWHQPSFTLAATRQTGASQTGHATAESTLVQVALFAHNGSTSAAAQSTTAAGPAAPVNATLPAELGSSAWQQQLGRQLARAVQNGHQQIQLHLHPRELGPLQISLHVDQQKVQAQFFATHVATRDAVQQALPQLRSALAQQGMALSDAMVGQQRHPSQQDRSSHSSSRRTRTSVASLTLSEIDTGPRSPILDNRRGLRAPGKLDTYA